ncbi:MAG: UvrD-helicase domain-containing protein, partial [Lachnospiraceae bacterium]|nr:UvrD-helicase domain-containing protein [Lachnospiraceae bacterium]
GLVERYEDPKKESTIAQMISALYEAAMSTAWPEEWLEGCKEIYEAETANELEATSFMQELERMCTDEFESCRKLAVRNLELAGLPVGPSCYVEALTDDVVLFDDLLAAKRFDKRYDILKDIKMTGLGSKRSSGEEETAMRERIKADREIYKNVISQMKKDIFDKDLEEHLEDVEATSGQAHTLIELAIEYGERLSKKKRKAGVMDFGDIEHNALKVLLDGRGSEAKASESAKELRAQFDEIMIDEYQDSNYIQELILTTIVGPEGEEPSLFVVGDVKQSIYSFRMAKPQLFIKRYERFSSGEGGKAIDLDKNFRSRANVLGAVNSLFERIMHAELGGVEYDEKAKLKPGAPYDGAGEKTEIHLIEIGDSVDEEDTSSKCIEAARIGLRIKEYVSDARFKVFDLDRQEYRPCEYGDIVILLRTMSGWSGEFAQTLSRMGIPVVADVSSGFFETLEVQTVLNYLRILDNPVQDIPFVAVLHSAIGGLSNDDLSVIKANGGPGDSFCEACRSFATSHGEGELGGRLRSFFETYDKLRAVVSDDLSGLIRLVCEETGFIYYVAMLDGADIRIANLRYLEDRAVAFAKTSYHGLFNFLRYVEKLRKHDLDYGEALSAAESGAVRIMSIHKSKGLEFPVVFLAGMGKRFNYRDAQNELIVHPEFGIASKRIDLDLRVKSETLLHKAFARFVRKSILGEEMRILYVAMTRAKEKLVITAAGKSFKDVECKDALQVQIEKSSRYIDLIRLAADAEWFDTYPIPADQILRAFRGADEGEEETGKVDLAAFFKGNDLADLRAVRNYDYSAGDSDIPVKITVSELKRRHAEAMYEAEEILLQLGVSPENETIPAADGEAPLPEEAEPSPQSAEEAVRVIPLPVFMGGEKGQNAGAALGTLCHLLLEHFPFEEEE